MQLCNRLQPVSKNAFVAKSGVYTPDFLFSIDFLFYLSYTLLINNQKEGKFMKIVFFGDSVTDCNRIYDDPKNIGDGYVKYTSEGLAQAFEGMEFDFINRGISGNRTCDLLARLDKDVISEQPDIVTILIGVNDTWRRFDNNDPTSAEQFRKNYEEILSRVKNETSAKVIMMEPFVIYGMGREEFREDLNEKIDVVRELAMKYADYYIPLDGILASAAVEYKDPTILSADGIHPAEDGKKVIAWHLMQVLYDTILEQYPECGGDCDCGCGCE